jgi:hypothetical protein
MESVTFLFWPVVGMIGLVSSSSSSSSSEEEDDEESLSDDGSVNDEDESKTSEWATRLGMRVSGAESA